MQSKASRELRQEAYRLLGQIIARADPGRLDAWAELGLTMTQLRLLFLLRREEGATGRALSQHLKVSPSALTRMVDRLVRHDLVRRRADDGDRRLVRHYLTSSGLRAVGEMERAGRARIDRVFQRLDRAQVERLVLALRDLETAVQEVEREEGSAGGNVR